MIRLLSKNNGVSLVEVLVASIIFAIAAVGTFTALSSLRGTSNISERSLQAAYSGQQIFEQLRGKIDSGTWDPNNWTDLGLNCTGSFHDWPDSLAGNPLVDNYNGKVQYNCVDITPPGIREVTLRVTWDEPS